MCNTGPLCVQSMGVFGKLGHQGDGEGGVGLWVPRAAKESRGLIMHHLIGWVCWQGIRVHGGRQLVERLAGEARLMG
jgi:hypothetical protein